MDDMTPSLQLHYTAFITTMGHSAPVPRIGTLVLVVLPLGRLPSYRDDRFPGSVHEPESDSRHLNAGRRSVSKQVSSELIPGQPTLPGFDVD